MKRIFETLWKVCKSRGLWSVLGIAWVLYFGCALYGWIPGVKRIFSYYDSSMPLLLLCVIVLVLYLAGMEKDFFRGFYRAFSRKRTGVSRIELQRFIEAFECAEKTAIVGGIVIIVLGFTDAVTSLGRITRFQLENMELIWMNITVLLAILSGDVVFAASFVLALLPAKVRIERKVISYMEEPEDIQAEKAEADGQKIYFGLRAMGLTDREAEVARLAGTGMSNREIGQQLYIAEGTVKKHMTHILEKAGCADREALRDRIREMYQG